MRTPAGMTPLEAAVGFVPGYVRARPGRHGPRGEAPLAALEAVVEPYLLRGRCVVAFSGGRDSSLVLAAAVRAARRSGAPLPVALSLRYPHLAETDEARWQELVVEHLGVDRWLRVDVGEDLDLIGPIARRQLLQHGPLFPANAYAITPMLPAAVGGSLLLGVGGDELLSGHRWQLLMDVLARRRPPQRRDGLRLAAALLPRAMRARTLAARDSVAGELTWLRPRARDLLIRAERRAGAPPLRSSRAVLGAAADPAVLLATSTLRTLGDAAGVAVAAPLLESRFVAALARAGGATGFGGRTAAMRQIARGALPEAVLARDQKAVFNRGLFGPEAHDFAARWSGGGLDPTLVDGDALRETWRAPAPDFRSAILLQVAWLSDHAAATQLRALGAVA